MPMTNKTAPLVYLDADVYLKVVKAGSQQPEEWVDAAHATLKAADRGDIRVAASTLVLAEVNSYRGDVDDQARVRLVDQYLRSVGSGAMIAELDLFTVDKAYDIGQQCRLRGADAVHLATAIRLKCDHFFTFNKRDFPVGTVVGGVGVSLPRVVWEPTLEDSQATFPPT